MFKRGLSILLTLLMLLSIAAPTVQASSIDEIYIENVSNISNVGSTDVEQLPETVKPEVEVIGPNENFGDSAMGAPQVNPSTGTTVSCNCGVEIEDLLSHSDSCAQKRFCIELCAGSAMEIYTQWYGLSTAERTFIKEYLGQNYSDTLNTLQQIWNSDQITDENDLLDGIPNPEAPERPTGEATTQIGDIIVDAEGIPEGSSLTVEDATKKATKAVEEKVDELGQNPDQLFLYDISVQNEESDDWQPEGTSVHMEITLPDVKLHKYATVYVVHVDDEGNTSTIEAKVTEDGAISFETEGFSTFGGFTVDFEYGTAFFSMQGLTELKLSELFDRLQMPLYASDAVNVTFTDYSLVSVSPLDGDWLLTSLQAFKTKELLTITMKDGTVYEIKVTDRVAPDIIVGGGGFDGTNEDYRDYNDNNEVVWYADGDGHLDTQSEYTGYDTHNDGWSKQYTVYVGGNGTFTIRIQPYDNVYNNTTCYVRIHQIRALNNADLYFILGGQFDNTSLTSCQIFGTDANMFFIDSGASLTIKGRPAVGNKGPCYLILDGRGGGTQAGGLLNTNDNQAIRLDNGATGLFAEYVRFQDCPRSAIKARNPQGPTSATRLQTFRLNRCIFDSDVRRESNTSTGSGGAIYVEDQNSGNYTWMDEFRLSNCTFNGTYAAESGGAIGIYGRVRDISVVNCDFNGTYSKKNYGGAIVMAGHASTMELSGCTFTNNSAPVAGGSIYIVSRVVLAANGTFSRLNELSVTNCTFKNDSYTSIADGKTMNSSLGGAMSLDSSINKVNISGCTFDKLLATEGAGVCFGYTNMTAKSDGTYAFMANTNFSTEANTTKAPPGAEGTDGSSYYRTTIGETVITNCDFNYVKAATQGGGIRFRTNSTVKSVTMDDVNFDGCEAIQAGSAIMLGDTIIPTLNYTNSIIQNCKTTLDSSDEVGGSFRTIGKTTCAATLTNVQFLNNASHCSGGGVYWNAAGVRYITEDQPITTVIALNQCVFDGNTAGWYGGGIYCESAMTVTGCEIKNNVSILIGGGIALQLYNNTVRPFANNETTRLVLDSATNIHHNQSKVGGGISIRANSTQAIANDIPYGHTIQFELGGAQVHHNYATTDGGGVWFNVETYDTSTEAGLSNQQEVERFNKIIDLTSGSVYSNIAGGNGGGVYMNGGDIIDPEDTTTGTLTSNGTVSINLSGAAIYDNEAGRLATGVITSEENVLPPTFTITKGSDGNIQFTKSEARGGNGGGIYLYGNVALCSITGGVVGATKAADGTPGAAMKNIATRSPDGSIGGCGGGIAIFGHGRIVMEGGYVINNTAETAGGGIAVHDKSSMYLVSGTIQNNSSHLGGGISMNNAQPLNVNSDLDQDKYGMFLNGGTISGNKVTPDPLRNNIAYGGGVCISGTSTVKISNGLITQNLAASDMDGSSFAANQEGGGVAACEGGNLTIAGGTISENSAYVGGGMVVRGASTINMTGMLTLVDGVVQADSATGVIKQNYAYKDGGGVHLGPYLGNNVNRFTMTNGWIYDNNAATGNGGAVYVGQYNGFYLHGGYIEENTAQENGGALYGADAVIQVKNGNIQENTAKAGGGIYSYRTKVEVSNGVIASNKATSGNGGGLYVYKADLYLYGTQSEYGSILDNQAQYGAGGGIYVHQSERVDVDYLKLEGNAGKYGGGMYIEFSYNTTIDGGVFNHNYSNQGAGLFVRSGITTINGGEFTNNYAGPSPKYADGTYMYVNDNNAQYGGGILVDHMTAGATPREAAIININGGTIANNEAPYGGGIWIKNFYKADTNYTLTVNMRDGIIKNNTAKDGGGLSIIGVNSAVSDPNTFLNVYGGTITENTANGKGGGVYAYGLVDVQILEDVEKDTHGTITNNVAYCGGGVAVSGGADLTVTNGYIIYNTAFVPANPAMMPAQTGYQQYGNLFGAGGGVFVADGLDDVTSTFTLSGNNMAIYGNEAGFSADDVFSNGKNTKLDVPHVSNMNLVGYGFNPEGWFEDYNVDDPKYAASDATGLNMMQANSAPANLGIQRYRSANAIQRRYSHIKPAVGTNTNDYIRGNEDDPNAEQATYNYVNKTNAYVAMTLGIPAAVDDTVVLDFGSNVTISLVDNDLFMEPEDFTNYGELGLVLPAGITNKDGVYYSIAKDADGNAVDHLGTFYEKNLWSWRLNFGSVAMGDGFITYAPAYNKNAVTFTGDAFTYTVKHGDAWFYANVNIVPATSIYIEDNKTGNGSVNGIIKYHTNADVDTYIAADGTEVPCENLSTWTTAGKHQSGVQDQDRPGASILAGLDADNIYGFDSSYTSTAGYSGGDAHFVTVFSAHDEVDDDNDGICDLCNRTRIHSWVNNDGNNVCDVCGTKHSATHTGACTPGDNHYCIICGRQTYRPAANARATFTFTGTGFDIISLCSNLTGSVTVSVYEGTEENIVFYDDPTTSQWEATDPIVTYMVETYYETGSALYQVPVIKADLTQVEKYDANWNATGTKYGYGTYTVELYIAPSFLPREVGYYSSDFYLDAIRIYNPAGIGGSSNKEAYDAYVADGENWPVYAELRNMFITQKNLSVETTNGIIFIDGNTNPTIEEYKTWGPNNEIYLNPGQSVAFTLNASNYAMSTDGNLNGDIVAGIHLGMRGLTGLGQATIYNGTKEFKSVNMGTTDLYYDITELMNQVVTITNDGSAPIAISNVKITHKYEPVVTGHMGDLFTMDTEAANVALNVLTPEQLVDPVLKPKYPALSFEGMVSYNVFFTAEELGDLNGADLGLAVFDSYQPEGTVETAKDVILGATQIDGLYMVETNGVHAKYLGDTQYFRAFAKKADGSYVYSKMVSYSALDYAKNVLEKSDDVKLKQLVVAMLNYGAEAQKFFGYNTDALMNKNLTAEQQALVSGIDAGSLDAVDTVDASKVGVFASTGGFTRKTPAISFKGAFEINYFFTPEHIVCGDMALYVWSEETYNNVAELTTDNADKIVYMTEQDGQYSASSDEIPAKYLDQTIYVAAVYQSNGQLYCTGVLPYSIAAYCQKPPASVQALATAAAIYGCTAKEYFNV